jgi:tetratricopeptide (TPR) repeat protein
MKKQITRVFIGVLFATLVVGPLQAKRRGGGGGGGDHLGKGVELAQQKQYDAAIAEFTKAIESDPKDVRAYTNRGTAYRAAGKVIEALADFSKAIEMAPKDPLAYLDRSQTELQSNPQAALDDASKAVELKPDDAAGYKLRGFAYISLQQWDKAIADFTMVIQKNPTDAQTYDQRALAYRNMKNYEAAATDYTAAIEKNPSYAPEYARRGYTYALAQQYEKAIADYEQTMKLDPNDVDTPMRLQYARTMLANKNAPPPTPVPLPTPEAPGLFTPLNIILALVVIGIIAVVVRMVTRGKPEVTSSTRIR